LNTISENRALKGPGNRFYKIGKYYERKAKLELEAAGYYVIRSAASKGIWDLVAIGKDDVRLVQVKGRSPAKPAERQAMAAFKCPPFVSKEYWRYMVAGKKEVKIYQNEKQN